MGVSKLLLASCLLALLAVATLGSPSLDDLSSDLSMLEAEAAPTAASVLSDAQAYAQKKVDAATEQARQLLANAAAEGRKDAEALGAAPAAPALSKAARERIAVKAAVESKRLEAVAAKKAARKAAKKAAREAKKAAAARFLANSPFKRGKALKRDAEGVFGASSFGVPKVESSPTAPAKRRGNRSALNRINKHSAKRDIYGRKKSCLKDIAAHFDEQDIYESKKLSLLQRMEHSKSRTHALRLRSKLTNLETWHQMMQRKFAQSENQAKDHAKRMERLFDTHLPQELKDQLKANKAAKRAAQKIPFPQAHAQALQVLRQKRSVIRREQREASQGIKKMIRPTLTNPGFPSMDPISSHLREKLWRVIGTENEWSTDKGDMELAAGVVERAHKAHGDFVEGPIAEPLLKGRLYKPDTEPLGQPNFFPKGSFPWPLKPQEKVTMDDKVKVEQTYAQSW